MLTTDRSLAHWCGSHHGVVTVDDLAAAGLTAREVERRLCSGVLVPMHPGVYRHAAHPPTFLARLHAAATAVGVGAYASGPSLMRLYDVRGEWSARPELTLHGVAHHVIDGVHLRRIDRLDPEDVRPRLGIPALAPELGLLLLGASVHRLRVEVAVHDMVFQRFTTRTKLIEVLHRYGGRGRRGAAAFRHAVRSLDPSGQATQTNLELRLLRAVRSAGLPEPELQHRVVDGDGRQRRLDLAWVDARLDVECDGDRWHLNPQDRAEMKRRDAALAAVGWTTARFGSVEVERGIDGVVRRIRRALDR